MRDGRRRTGQGAQAVFRVDRNCGLLGWGDYRRGAVVAAMNEIFAAVEGRSKRRQGITGQTIEAQMRGTMCQITEYELDVLRDEIARLTAELEERDKRVSTLSRLAQELTDERDEARAETAMALKLAVNAVWDVQPMAYTINVASVMGRAISALTPAHAKDALADLREERDTLREWDNYFRSLCGFKRDGRASPECLDEYLAARDKATREQALLEAAVVADKKSVEWWSEYKDRMSQNCADPHYQGLSDGAEEVSQAILALI